MINQPTTAPENEPPRRLQLPVQAAPIDRSLSAASAITGAGVEADVDVEDLIKLGTTIGGWFSDRALKRDIIPVDWSR
jgi:hypothetical protein